MLRSLNNNGDGVVLKGQTLNACICSVSNILQFEKMRVKILGVLF